jgi:hypothetical protein
VDGAKVDEVLVLVVLVVVLVLVLSAGIRGVEVVVWLVVGVVSGDGLGVESVSVEVVDADCFEAGSGATPTRPRLSPLP